MIILLLSAKYCILAVRSVIQKYQQVPKRLAEYLITPIQATAFLEQHPYIAGRPDIGLRQIPGKEIYPAFRYRDVNEHCHLKKKY
jgi:hypothetical protein